MAKSTRKKPRKTKPRRSKPRKTKPRRSKPRRSKPRRSKPRRSKPRRSKPRRSKPRKTKPIKPRKTKRKTTMFSSRGISLRGGSGDDRKNVIEWLKNNEDFINIYEKLGLPAMPEFEDSYESKKLRASTGMHNSAKREAKAFAKKMKSELETVRTTELDLLVCLFKYMISIAVYVLAGAIGYRKTFNEKALTNLATKVATPLVDEFESKKRTEKKSLNFIRFINRKYPDGWPIKPEPKPNSPPARGADLVPLFSQIMRSIN